MGKISEFDNFGVEDMERKEREASQRKLSGLCKCKACPSFVTGDDSVAFCFPLMGTSSVIKHEKGCLCESCPVYADYELTHSYYCTRCSQVCQAYKAEVGGGHE